MFFNESPMAKKKAGNPVPAKIDLSRIKYKMYPFIEMSDEELMAAQGEEFITDSECFENYWMVGFRHVRSGKIVFFERDVDGLDFNVQKLQWLMLTCRTIGFNTIKYDLGMIFAACAGYSNKRLMMLSNEMIHENVSSYNVCERLGFKMPKMNHIDLFNVSPLKNSLKGYAANLFSHSIQDLPFEVGKSLEPFERKVVKHYNTNDLQITQDLFVELIPQLESREKLSQMYGINLMSKSDAQIAEAVIVSEVAKLKGYRPRRPEFETMETRFQYVKPDYVMFQTPLMQEMLNTVCNAVFMVDGAGSPMVPKSISEKKIQIGRVAYQMGNGGLHSTEECSMVIADEQYFLRDIDVASFYPRMILNNRWFPKQLGQEFLTIYQGLVDQRLAAKKAKNMVVAEGMKITINGGFGKFGSMFSTMYAPDLMIQVTITGQLSLLMLIEALHLIQIEVVSANTDGIVVRCARGREKELDDLIKLWEQHTKLEMESTQYLGLYSRDVNSYIAIKEEFDSEKKIYTGKVAGHKLKGAYINDWEKPGRNIWKLHHNPTNLICIDAVVAFLEKGTPIEETINACTDVTKFISVRKVKGGGVQDGVYLGKVVRWYYSKENRGAIRSAHNNHKVSRSNNAKPMMELKDKLPYDLDIEWYINEAVDYLAQIGYIRKKQMALIW